MAQDSAKHFYPLAWAVVDKETGRTWKWFMELLRSSLELKDGEGVTFMSDMQKGLIDAVNSVLPKSHHRWCVRHIEANRNKNWRSVQMKKLMWWCAWSTYEDEFNDQLTSLGTVSEKATKELIWPKMKRKREKGEARKREGAWSSSRKELLMTCGYCSNRGHNILTCALVNKKMNLDAGSSQEVQDVPLTAPQESQTSEQVQQFVDDEWEGEEEDEDEDNEPILRPKVISESKIRLRQKILQRLPIGTRKINFKGDEFSVVEPTNLPYSPKKVNWKGKAQ